VSWVRNALKDETMTLTKYWGVFSSIFGDKSSLQYSIVTRNGATSVISVSSPISHNDLEFEWEKYARAFGATDVDRVLIEEQVKVMVLFT
jgi:hypothetical protein